MATKVNEATKDVAEEVVSSNVENDEVITEEINEIREYIPTGVMVYRKKYKKDGKEFYSYHSSKKTRRGEITCNFIPADVGGYEQLDMVFFDEKVKEMPLFKSPYSIKDENGKVTNGFSYYVRDYDEEEKIWFEAKIKPSKSSDKGNLDTLLILAER